LKLVLAGELAETAAAPSGTAGRVSWPKQVGRAVGIGRCRRLMMRWEVDVGPTSGPGLAALVSRAGRSGPELNGLNKNTGPSRPAFEGPKSAGGVKWMVARRGVHWTRPVAPDDLARSLVRVGSLGFAVGSVRAGALGQRFEEMRRTAVGPARRSVVSGAGIGIEKAAGRGIERFIGRPFGAGRKAWGGVGGMGAS